MKSIPSILLLVFLAAAFNVSASENYVCDNHGEKRLIKITYHNEQQPVPCEVRYDKGQGEQILWSAQSEAGFCETKADEFIQKQESWGWSCEKFQDPVADQSLPEVKVSLEELQTSLY